jgi:hypothetical protein
MWNDKSFKSFDFLKKYVFVFQYNLQVLFLNNYIVTSHNMKSKNVISSTSGFFM